MLWDCTFPFEAFGVNGLIVVVLIGVLVVGAVAVGAGLLLVIGEVGLVEVVGAGFEIGTGAGVYGVIVRVAGLPLPVQ